MYFINGCGKDMQLRGNRLSATNSPILGTRCHAIAYEVLPLKGDAPRWSPRLLYAPTTLKTLG